jgi:hypothetical protein
MPLSTNEAASPIAGTRRNLETVGQASTSQSVYMSPHLRSQPEARVHVHIFRSLMRDGPTRPRSPRLRLAAGLRAMRHRDSTCQPSAFLLVDHRQPANPLLLHDTDAVIQLLSIAA